MKLLHFHSIRCNNIPLLFLSFCLLFLPIIHTAQAATVDLPKTGQTSLYAVGDDGDAEAGVVWPSPRFINNNDGTITDNLTGLIWLENANCFYSLWSDAISNANGLTDGSCGLTDGSSAGDWRLPNINELESLISAGESNSATWLNAEGFANAQSSYYWSATTYADVTSNAWGVYMSFGSVSEKNKTSSGYVWPVRAATTLPAQVWKTGQTTKDTTGDDGDLQEGVDWFSPRFTDNGDGTITDNLTGLIWLQKANCFEARTWSTAVSDVNSLANWSCGLSDGSSAGDWRLPNRKELFSLIDRSQSNPALLSGHPFANMSNYYWSATTYANGTSSAWLVGMLHGHVSAGNKQSVSFHALPVRAEHPDISVSPTSVDFGSVASEGTSTPQTLTISNLNIETSNLVIGTISVTAITGTDTSDFTIQNDYCSGLTITSSGSCTVRVFFSGIEIGNRNVNLSIPSNDPDTPILTVPLTGFSLAVPTLSEWGMLIFTILILLSGIVLLNKRWLCK